MESKDWKKLLPGCFAGMDAPFGVDPNDEKRAIRMFHVALNQRATFSDPRVCRPISDSRAATSDTHNCPTGNWGRGPLYKPSPSSFRT